MVLIEAVSRTDFLVVHWSAKESSSLSLGARPILVGSSPKAHVLLAEDDDAAPIVASIAVVKDTVQLKDHSGNTRSLHDGEILTYGRIRIEVRAPRAEQPAEPTSGLGAGVKAARARESAGAR